MPYGTDLKYKSAYYLLFTLLRRWIPPLETGSSLCFMWQSCSLERGRALPRQARGTALLGRICLMPRAPSPRRAAHPALHQAPLFPMEFPCSAPSPSFLHGVSLQDEAQLIFKPNASNLDHTKFADKPLWQRKPSIPLSLFGSQSCQSAKQAPLTAGNQSQTKQGCRVSASLEISASLRISAPLENPLAARPASRSEALALLPRFSLTLPWC